MSPAAEHPTTLAYPELIIGIAGPIGVDMDMIARSIEAALTQVSYTSS
jgi:hypothetical protein